MDRLHPGPRAKTGRDKTKTINPAKVSLEYKRLHILPKPAHEHRSAFTPTATGSIRDVHGISKSISTLIQCLQWIINNKVRIHRNPPTSPVQSVIINCVCPASIT